MLFHKLKDKDRFRVNGMDLQCFDILSTKEKQFGFGSTCAGRKAKCQKLAAVSYRRQKFSYTQK